MKLKEYLIYFSMLLLITANSLFLFIDEFKNIRIPSSSTGNKVCLVIVDGLRYDSACKMINVNNIMKEGYGIDYKVFAEMPSISRPGYERIISGASSYINGVSSNLSFLPSTTPGLFKIAREANLKTAVSGFYWFRELYLTEINYGYFYLRNDSHVFDKGVQFINKYKPDLVVIHPMSLDRAGHKYGGKSKEYDDVVVDIDNEIMKLFPYVKNGDYTLIIASDHGHKDSGGHGDMDIKSIEVPFFIIKPKNLPIEFKDKSFGTSQKDIAPTICDILGISKTIYMSGNSLVKSDMENSSIKYCFSSFKIDYVKNNFIKSFNLSQIVICLFTLIYIGCWIMIIKAVRFLK